jgi:hypothetical protein
MAWLIGIDEAGYGPNLGPLAVAATVWRVQGSGFGDQDVSRGRSDRASGGGVLALPATAVDLYERLSSIVSAMPDDDRLAIADSKVLYKPGGGLRLLERGVLTARAAVVGDDTARWGGLFAGFDTAALPWYAGYDCDLPIDATTAEIATLSNRFTTACGFAAAELVDVQTRLIFPREFNDLTDHYGTKGAALSHVSIGLLRSVLEGRAVGTTAANAGDPEPCFVTCDKHGGRNRYGALLQHHFPEDWIETHQESRPASRYAWGPMTVNFRTKGEEELPTALASMTAKYHRELAMRAFNKFWTSQIAGLRPTAGYPQDAKRFKKEIAHRQCELGIDDRDLWRNR